MSVVAGSGVAIPPRAASDSQDGLPPGPGFPMLVQTLLAIFFTERFTAYCLRRFDALVTLWVAGLGTVVSVRVWGRWSKPGSTV
jgi:hypothetical protein